MPATLQSDADGCLALAGALDFASVPGLYRQLTSHFQPGASLSIDLGAVERFNSAGLALLLQCLEDARKAKVELVFRNLPSAHGELASLYNLTGLFGKE